MATDQPDSPPEPPQTGGVVRFVAPLAWVDWWVKGRLEGEPEPEGRPAGL